MISVITCTLNPRMDYIVRVLEGLKRQTLSKDGWEYIIVDNGSVEPLRARIDLSWHPQARVVEEPEPGLTPARLRGIAEARGDILVFVDDDCVLREDYLVNADKLMREYPHVGAWGAYLEGEFEVPVPAWLKEFAWTLCAMQYFKVKRLPVQYAMSHNPSLCTPAGAGMVIRKMVADHYVGEISEDEFRRLLDRKGKSLTGSGDLDMAYTAIDMGMAVGTATSLHLTHLIPAGRMEVAYLRRILYSGNYSTARLLVHRGWRDSVPIAGKNRVKEAIKNTLKRFRPLSPRDELWKAYSKGYSDGIAGLPFDPHYL